LRVTNKCAAASGESKWLAVRERLVYKYDITDRQLAEID
jgi:hypothetical protein